ncbi:MAG: hypothetical protein OXG15_12480 [Gammaproteobacteria bacterium]|nr:hypothetical protein [Gammaproteobacteria bacterium]
MSPKPGNKFAIPSDRIGTLREGALHRDLKSMYASAGALTEQLVGKYVVDILDGEHVIEIQTANFTALSNKLPELLETHSVTVVYPISVTKMIVKHTDIGEQRRKSPRIGSALDVFDELVYMPSLLDHPNLELELVYVSIEEHREFDPKRAWRRRHWVVSERRLNEVTGQERFSSMSNLFDRFAGNLPSQFTTATIAKSLGTTRNKAQKFAYCFRQANVIHACGKDGNAVIYQRRI